MLRDPNEEVTRSAWRAAVVLIPDDEKKALAEELATQFGRGNRDMQLSLSRALISLGAEVVEPVLQKAMAGNNPITKADARATERLLCDPNAAFELDLQDGRLWWLWMLQGGTAVHLSKER